MFASKDSLLTRPSGYNIARSVRTRSSASGYFSRTPATATNQKVWTWSGWVKRGALGTEQSLFATVSQGFSLFFGTGNDLRVWTNGGNGAMYTSAVYRDVGAWYHIVLQRTSASPYFNLYVNGVQVTAFAFDNRTTYPGTADSEVNSTVAHYISGFTSYYFDGYLTEINFIDGQALTPSSFGETDSITGVWKPKAYSGTYGTNGFELNFSDNSNNTAATIGKDYSGNGNNWTPNNISVTAGVTYDSMVDSPTVGSLSSNYCVWSPIDKGSVTVTNGNLSAVATADVAALRGTMGLPQSGKWYWEVTVSGLGYGTGLGIADNACPISNFNAGSTQSRTFQWGSWLNTYNSGVVQYGTNQSVLSGSNWSGASQLTTNDTVMIAVDMDNGSMWVGKNGTWFNSSGTANPATNTDPRWTGLTGTTWFPVYASYGTGSPPTANANFGQRPFSYTPPTGFVALNTYNLPASTIKNGAAYMAATTYTGNVTARNISNAVNGVSFQPDFVWLKNRTTAYGHVLQDSIRGTSVYLASNSNAADTAASLVTAFNSDGFAVSTSNVVNENSAGIVGWQWKAGGTAVSNTAGSITSTVSVGATQGFSVVSFTSPASGSFTVGHGLNAVPNLIITKPTSRSAGWVTYHSSLNGGNPGTSYFVYLDTTAGQASLASPPMWGSAVPTSSVFGASVSATCAGSEPLIAYCFSAVAGYSAFGSFTGNGSADGPFVYTGFRPTFVMAKLSSATGDWNMVDDMRQTYNDASGNPVLRANLNNTEEDVDTMQGQMDILSNGFKLRSNNSSLNANGGTIIYAAFAENPFKYALAR